jgi:hypothetical protein
VEGSSEEYERLALAALKKAGEPASDATYHNNRAIIFATLAQAAAAAELAEAQNRPALPQGA